ncbi:patatin [Rhizobium leguminosarum bv. viciae]|uniref:patatin-like phospholipase family protein n=1 Tax=Rhizobium ruizarguesonis TaxID=2081791 RepID=UPI00143F3A09|nr:patatin-like phospholipase family protein [Rhizobium ruizarguesonis]NKJ73544.1 patatin [Rhizobium leguminosarum bv. viciae]NKQ71711.1 patatin [Rhizobium ruizarguesonis]NKQ79206.1 patatin [Rhizobium ruizarguesonis]
MTNASEISQPRPYRVLCIDGGGMRGIYTAALLEKLTRYYATLRNEEALDIGKGFDLIAGTSTGAILGCAAAIGRPMSSVVKLYEDHGSSIFPHRIKDGVLSPLWRALTKGNSIVRAGDAALQSALRKELQNVTMKQVLDRRGIALSVPAVSMERHRSWVFKKTPKSGVRDDNYRLADVCLASSAAPIYRSLAAIRDPDTDSDNFRIFADGGLWANNPVLVAMIDALSCAAPEQPIEIFSFGNISRPAGSQIKPKKVHRSMLSWKLGTEIGPLAIDVQQFAYDHMARFFAEHISRFGRPITHVRIPQQEAAAAILQYLSLDESRRDALKALIAHGHGDADMVKSLCNRRDHPEGKMIHKLLSEIPPMPKAGIPMEVFL